MTDGLVIFIPNNWKTSIGYHTILRFFFVEIDSTFYKIPSRSMVSNWNKRTPTDFKFTVKFPQIITHEYSTKTVLTGIEDTISMFMDAMKPLHKKILAFLIQFPPWLKIKEGMDYLGV